jgi:hypothetical protein
MTVSRIKFAAVRLGDMIYIPGTPNYHIGWGRVLQRYISKDREYLTFKLAGEFKLNDITLHVGRTGWNKYTEIDRYR